MEWEKRITKLNRVKSLNGVDESCDGMNATTQICIQFNIAVIWRERDLFRERPQSSFIGG
jgi:hypothetical protein